MTEKKGLHPALAFALMLAMLSCALFYGAQRHWKGERALVEAEAFVLQEAMDARVETAHNLLTVAYRHMEKDDALCASVSGDLAAMKNASLPLSTRAAACENFIDDAKALLAALAQKDSVINDSRDHMYATLMLPQAVETCQDRSVIEQYDQCAAAFNDGLQGSFSGLLARLSGIGAAERIAADTAVSNVQ